MSVTYTVKLREFVLKCLKVLDDENPSPGLETLDEEEEAAAAVAVDELGDNARLHKSSLLPLVLPHVPDHRRSVLISTGWPM